MLSNTLNTNEVKDAAGAEVEFTSIRQLDRERDFAKIAETPSLPHRLTVKHQENGVGLKMRRRSVIRVDKTTMSGVDATLPITTSAYLVLDTPCGASSSMAEAANVLAEVTSFIATLGTSTFLYDGTGTGAVVLLNGGV